MKLKPVVSASRRIDMVGSCPERLLEILDARFSPDRTHTVVIWTKAPGKLASDPSLRAMVAAYRSVYVHATITGMGATDLEPGVPPTEESLEALGRLIPLVSGPDHVGLRFDPIVHLTFPDGTSYTNLPRFETVARSAAGRGIRRVVVSWMQVYRKVERRLGRMGIRPEVPDSEGRATEAGHLRRLAGSLGMELVGCCVPDWPTGACIDGALLQHIHPEHEPCSRAKAQGQRDLCGCTRSIDIGWYGPCAHGCVYCYANPAETTPKEPEP